MEVRNVREKRFPQRNAVTRDGSRCSLAHLNMTDVNSGLVKALVFGILITQICCYFGLKTEGGSVGLGRNVMVAVVSSLVAVILADALATAFINNYIL